MSNGHVAQARLLLHVYWQAPPEQVTLATLWVPAGVQFVPQEPQCKPSLLFCVSTQEPLQHVLPPVHAGLVPQRHWPLAQPSAVVEEQAVVQEPQVAMLFCVSAQEPRQHLSPPVHAEPVPQRHCPPVHLSVVAASQGLLQAPQCRPLLLVSTQEPPQQSWVTPVQSAPPQRHCPLTQASDLVGAHVPQVPAPTPGPQWATELDAVAVAVQLLMLPLTHVCRPSMH